MARKLHAEEARLWGHVTATVRPMPGRATPKVETDKPVAKTRDDALPPKKTTIDPRIVAARPKLPKPPEIIEPGRHKRIVRGHEPLEARIDLHGMTHDRARATLEAFILRVWSEGHREVLVITGKGSRGEGILRRFTPEWLAAPPLRDLVAGISTAHRRHGGDGALYVALKRKAKP
ncbi:MAG: Smr/MutS family protein [Pseudomonadota bacterium]